MVLKKHEGYVWGPPIFKNPSPQVDRVIWRVIPDSNTILAAIQSGQGDATQYVPPIALPSLRNTPGITLSNQPNYFWDYFVGFKIDKPAVNDPVLRKAMVMAVNRDAIAKAVWFGAATPADSYLNPAVLDYDPKSKADFPAYDPAAARKLLDAAGWTVGSDGIRAKDGVRASFLLYGISDTLNNRSVEAIQADLKRIGVEMKVQMWDATVAWGKLATQEFGAFMMSYPYVSRQRGAEPVFQLQRHADAEPDELEEPRNRRLAEGSPHGHGRWREADRAEQRAGAVDRRQCVDPAGARAALGHLRPARAWRSRAWDLRHRDL